MRRCVCTATCRCVLHLRCIAREQDHGLPVLPPHAPPFPAPAGARCVRWRHGRLHIYSFSLPFHIRILPVAGGFFALLVHTAVLLCRTLAGLPHAAPAAHRTAHTHCLLPAVILQRLPGAASTALPRFTPPSLAAGYAPHALLLLFYLRPAARRALTAFTGAPRDAHFTHARSLRTIHLHLHPSQRKEEEK